MLQKISRGTVKVGDSSSCPMMEDPSERTEKSVGGNPVTLPISDLSKRQCEAEE